MAVLQDYEFTNVPAATGQSDELDVGHLTNKTVLLAGGVYDADIEISRDGVLWIKAQTGLNVTAAGLAANVAQTARLMRINITAFTSGTPTAFVQAHSSTEGT